MRIRDEVILMGPLGLYTTKRKTEKAAAMIQRLCAAIVPSARQRSEARP